MENVFISFRKLPIEKRKQLLNFYYQNVNFLCLGYRHVVLVLPLYQVIETGFLTCMHIFSKNYEMSFNIITHIFAVDFDCYTVGSVIQQLSW